MKLLTDTGIIRRLILNGQEQEDNVNLLFVSNLEEKLHRYTAERALEANTLQDIQKIVKSGISEVLSVVSTVYSRDKTHVDDPAALTHDERRMAGSLEEVRGLCPCTAF